MGHKGRQGVNTQRVYCIGALQYANRHGRLLAKGLEQHLTVKP